MFGDALDLLCLVCSVCVCFVLLCLRVASCCGALCWYCIVVVWLLCFMYVLLSCCRCRCLCCYGGVCLPLCCEWFDLLGGACVVAWVCVSCPLA